MKKSLVVLCDGTWQTADQQYPTNVRLMHSALNKRDHKGRLQLAFYQQGVGADGLAIEKILGGTSGLGLSDNIKEAYHFIVENYSPGDRLFLLGFSRGAFTARSLAGLIGCAGILKHDAFPPDRWYVPDILCTDRGEAIDTIYEMYRDQAVQSEIDAKVPADSRHRGVEVDMVGVWDTVGSLGIPILDPDSIVNRRYQFHNVKLGRHIKRAYHAVSIDELRQPFAPTLWEADNTVEGQVVEQVWFAGDHGGVGGGRFVDGLSNIAFQWMCRKLTECGVSLNTSDSHPEGIRHPDRKPYVKDPVVNEITGFYKRLGEHQRDMTNRAYAGIKVHATVHAKIKDGYKPAAIYDPDLPVEDIDAAFGA